MKPVKQILIKPAKFTLVLVFYSCVGTTFTVSGVTSRYCQTNPLENSFYDDQINVLFKTSSCLKQFKILYYYTSMCCFEVHMYFAKHIFKMLQLLHIFIAGITLVAEPNELVLATNSRILLKTVILIPSEEIPSMNCIISLENGTKITAISNESQVMVINELPQLNKHRCFCKPASRQRGLSIQLSLIVEDRFSQIDLGMSCSVCSGKYQKDFNVTFVHQNVVPVEYILTIGSLQLSNYERILDEPSLLNKSSKEKKFLLSVSDQVGLGPGIHKSALTLYNNISSARILFNVYLNQELIDFNVGCNSYIGSYPSYFSTSLSLRSGAPAQISVTLKSANNVVASVNTSCDNATNCKSFQVEIMSPHKVGLYWIAAKARNDINSVNAKCGPVESLPQVYNVYAKANEAYVGENSVIDTFVHGDVGKYSLNIFVDGKQFNKSFEITGFNNEHNTRLPFDGRSYKHIKQTITFLKGGYRNLIISINNTKQIFNFTTRIHVRNQQSCFQGINIRGGSSTTTTDPLEIGDYVILSANTTISCLENTQFLYNWRLFKVESPSELPKSDKEIPLKTTYSQSEIVFKQSELQPGIYLVFITFLQSGTGSSAPVTETEDFAIFKIVYKPLQTFIRGGKRREIGDI